MADRRWKIVSGRHFHVNRDGMLNVLCGVTCLTDVDLFLLGGGGCL